MVASTTSTLTMISCCSMAPFHLHNALFLLLFIHAAVSAPLSTHSQVDIEQVITRRRVLRIPTSDVDMLEFPLNLEFLEAEFFLWGSTAKGLDEVAPDLAQAGPPPIGASRADLDPFTRDVIAQFAYQEVGHIRAIRKTVRGFPRPQIDLSRRNFAAIMDTAMGRRLQPPFDPYENSVNYLIASYLVPYVGLTGYVGANPHLKDPLSKRVLAGLLGVESAQDAVIRTLLYQQATATVKPYNITVAEFADRISALRNKLGGGGVKDEGIVVPPDLGAERKVAGNLIPGDRDSLSYGRTPEEILKIVYGTGSAGAPGGFFPKGAQGRIAKSHLRRAG